MTGKQLKKALLVEDHLVQQKVLSRYLEQMGYRIEVAENAGTAIEFVKNKSYALILLDLGLPDQPGETIIQAVRGSPLNQSTPILVCTAHASKEKEQHCLELGANKVLIKPIIKLEILEQALKGCF